MIQETSGKYLLILRDLVVLEGEGGEDAVGARTPAHGSYTTVIRQSRLRLIYDSHKTVKARYGSYKTVIRQTVKARFWPWRNLALALR